MAQITIEQAWQIALQCHQAGQLPQAEHLYKQILAAQPDHADALHYFGVLSHQLGRNESAMELIRRAVRFKPVYPEAFNHLGAVLCSMGRLEESIAACRQAIGQREGFADAHYNLGNALKDSARLAEAITAYRRAIELQPLWPLAHNNLITALIEDRQLEQALIAARQAVALLPESPDALCSLGNALRSQGKWDEAIALYRQAITLDPRHASACSELGFALQNKGEWENATDAYRRALSLDPNLADAHFNLSTQLLLVGDFDQGWKEYEWRWRLSGPAAAWHPPHPRWDGCDLNGRTILLHREQGFGDLLQFVRYVPMVASRGGKVVVVCAPEQRRLLQPMDGIDQCLVPGEPLPPIDVQCPLLSLPLIFKTTLEDIPCNVPYLLADRADCEKWRKQLAGDDGKLKIGLVWAGRPNHANDARRSISLAALAPLAQVTGISFYSLQIGEPAAHAKSPPPGMNLVDHTEALIDFAETAAFIANLDLVISVDTAVVHLTGALGKPVWTLLPYVPDWRWLLDRNDSPWYPTMRLFRQPTAGDWNSVIGQVADALGRFTLNRS